MIMYTGKKRTIEAVQRLRLAFPVIPIYARAQDLMHLLDLKKAGATDAILESAETSLQLGSKLLKGFGVMSDDVSFLSQLVRDSMELQAQEALGKTDGREFDVMKPLQVRVGDFNGAQEPISSTSNNERLSRVNDTDVSRALNYQEEIGKATHDGDHQLSDDLDGKGVLYCELDEENGFQEQSEEAGEEKMVKP
ncbi:K(+) efflux antiporter 3, chloroplastic-like [Pistacia vera]|nr:K(+) efflux antiporter 3, chloroplastic-like [Pistacia vera]